MANGTPSQNFDDLSPKIRKILMDEWDPIGVAENPDAQDEYDGFIAPLFLLVKANASEETIGAFLHDAKTKDLGLFDGVFHKKRNRAIARMLIALMRVD